MNGPRNKLALDTNLFFHLAEGRDYPHAFREAFQQSGYALRFAPTVMRELVAAEVGGVAVLSRNWRPRYSPASLAGIFTRFT